MVCVKIKEETMYCLNYLLVFFSICIWFSDFPLSCFWAAGVKGLISKGLHGQFCSQGSDLQILIMPGRSSSIFSCSQVDFTVSKHHVPCKKKVFEYNWKQS